MLNNYEYLKMNSEMTLGTVSLKCEVLAGMTGLRYWLFRLGF